MATPERAISIVAAAHAGTVDKAGAPYIVRPLRVMLKMTDSVSADVVDHHDVVEDSKHSKRLGFEGLQSEEFSEEILSALNRLIFREGRIDEVYSEHYMRNPLPKKMDIRDLEGGLNTRSTLSLTLFYL